MQPDSTKDLKIFRVLTFKRGQDTGSLKIIAQNESAAYRIARSVLKQSPNYFKSIISFRLLELCSIGYKGQTERVLSKEGVI